MKKIFILIAAVLPLIFSGCAKRVIDTTISIYGIVIDKESQLPLDGVTITIFPGVKITKVTSSDGSYEFIDLPYKPEYIIQFNKDGYGPERKYLTNPIAGESYDITISMERKQ